MNNFPPGTAGEKRAKILLEEDEWVEKDLGRCVLCLHKAQYHSWHCCPVCLVCNECKLEWGVPNPPFTKGEAAE